MLRMVCSSLAYKGTSWKAEIGCPSFVMKTRCSFVLGAPILWIPYSVDMVLSKACVSLDSDVGLFCVDELERCRAISADRVVGEKGEILVE